MYIPLKEAVLKLKFIRILFSPKLLQERKAIHGFPHFRAFFSFSLPLLPSLFLSSPSPWPLLHHSLS